MPKLYLSEIVSGYTPPTQPGDLEWDSRLDQRGARLLRYPARPGDTFYRLVKGQWFNVDEAQGKANVFVDVLDEHGKRLTGIPCRFINGGEFVKSTEAKPDEGYALDFPMYAVAPAYRLEITYASDIVSGLGMGSIEAPDYAEHTSYLFVYQRTTQGGV